MMKKHTKIIFRVRLFIDQNQCNVNPPNQPRKPPNIGAPRNKSNKNMHDDAIFHPPTAEELNKAEFQNQYYLNEVAAHLIDDINQLKKEVIPMRKEIRFLIQLETNFTDTFNPKPSQPNKIRIRSDITSQITELNVLLDELNNAWQEVRTTYSDYSQNLLMENILDENQSKSQIEEEIQQIEEILELQQKKKQIVRESEVRHQIKLNNKKIEKLNNLKDSLEFQGKVMLENLQDSFNNRPYLIKEQAKAKIPKLEKKLELVQHVHMRREQDFDELKAKYIYQKQQLLVIKDEREKQRREKERQRKEKADLERRITAAREKALKDFEEHHYKARIEKKKQEKSSNNSGPIPNKANRRLFDEEEMNSKARQIQNTNQIEPISRIKPKKQVTFNPEPPKQRYHHHRRHHRKHHNDDPGPYVFTTSDPMNGHPMNLISTQPEEDYDESSSNEEETNHETKNDFLYDFQSDD